MIPCNRFIPRAIWFLVALFVLSVPLIGIVQTAKALTSEEIIKLKEVGVSEEAIMEMIKKEKLTNSAKSPNPDVERLLVQFYNKNLPGVQDYQQKIQYPKSGDYYSAWAALVISIGKDTALVITAGQSEPAVKIIEGSFGVGDIALTVKTALEGKPGKASTVYLVGRVPGLRKGVNVYGVVKADIEGREKIFTAISQQREIVRFVGAATVDAANINSAIASVRSEAKKMEYQQMLSAMLQKRAELAIYRQMTLENGFSGDHGMALDRAIDAAIPGRVADDAYTANMSFGKEVNEYIQGSLSGEDFDAFLRNEIKSRIGPTPRTDIDTVLNEIKIEREEADSRRYELNKYGGGTAYKTNTAQSYASLVSKIPYSYRLVSNIDVLASNIDVRDLRTVPNSPSHNKEDGTLNFAGLWRIKLDGTHTTSLPGNTYSRPEPGTMLFNIVQTGNLISASYIDHFGGHNVMSGSISGNTLTATINTIVSDSYGTRLLTTIKGTINGDRITGTYSGRKTFRGNTYSWFGKFTARRQ